MAQELGNWAINYLPEGGGRLTGKLVLTEEDLRFRALYDSSTKEVLKGIGLALGSFAASGGHGVYLNESDTEMELVLPVAAMENVEATKKGMMKQVVVTMEDDHQFVFDYGMLSVKKIVAAIESVLPG